MRSERRAGAETAPAPQAGTDARGAWQYQHTGASKGCGAQRRAAMPATAKLQKRLHLVQGVGEEGEQFTPERGRVQRTAFAVETQ